jgi:hypothetical protein
MNAYLNILLILGAIMIFFSSLQIVGYFARGRVKWPIWGIMIFYWLLYLGGIYLAFGAPRSCTDHFYCDLTQVGGVTMIVFGYSAVAFYLLTVYSYTSLIRKVRKLNFSDQFTEKIRTQHARAVIVFFFTTWVAAGFVYLIHHRAAVIIKKAIKNPDSTNRKELESELDKVFGRTVDWHKEKKSKKG